MINLILVGITCIISFVAFKNEALLGKMLHRPYDEVHRNEKYRLLTSGFIHADLFHLLINMFVLYQFGSMVEDRFNYNYGLYGSAVYLVFYLVSIVLANLKTHFKYKDNHNYSALGASGATSAVLFAFIYYAPTSKLGLYGIIPVPAIIFGVLYLWYSDWAGKRGGDNIGHDAHFFGAIAGFVLAVLLDPKQIFEFFNLLVNGW